MAAQIAPDSENMKAAYVNEWSAPGTVADSISFGEVPSPDKPLQAEVLVGVKAASISGDDVGLLQVRHRDWESRGSLVPPSFRSCFARFVARTRDGWPPFSTKA